MKLYTCVTITQPMCGRAICMPFLRQGGEVVAYVGYFGTVATQTCASNSRIYGSFSAHLMCYTSTAVKFQPC